MARIPFLRLLGFVILFLSVVSVPFIVKEVVNNLETPRLAYSALGLLRVSWFGIFLGFMTVVDAVKNPYTCRRIVAGSLATIAWLSAEGVTRYLMWTLTQL